MKHSRIILFLIILILSGCSKKSPDTAGTNGPDSLAAAPDSLIVNDSIAGEFAFIMNDADQRIYTEAETLAEFPGGKEALVSFIQTELQYPVKSLENGSEGVVGISFIIGGDGTVTEVQVINPSDDELLNAEAARVVRNMPDWEPAEIDGEPVSLRYILPVSFALN